MFKGKINFKKITIGILLFAVAILSITFVSNIATSTDFHANSIEVLDNKKVVATGMATSITVLSTAISALPGDTASPVAQQLSQLIGLLLLIVCAIYLEKILLTITGYISFTWLIPIACGLGIGYLLTNREIFIKWSMKLSLFAIAIFMIVPTSVKVTQLVEANFQETINQAFNSAEEIEENTEKDSDENKGFFSGIVSAIGESVSNIANTAKNALNVFIDAIAVLVITTCVVPIGVVWLFMWLLKVIFGININTSGLTKKLNYKSEKIGFNKK